MSSEDMLVADALNRMLPPIDDRGDWTQVVADASKTHRRRRRVFALALAVAAIAVLPVVGLAASNGWWFFADGAPAPSSRIVVVERGRAHGTPWALTAYSSAKAGMCVAFTTNPPTSVPAQALRSPVGMQCAPLRKLGFVLLPGSPATGFPTVVFGPASPKVAQVSVTLSNGHRLSVQTIAPRAGLGRPVRFFLVETPPTQGVRVLVGADASGRTVARIVLRVPPSTTGSGPGARTYTYSWGS